MGGFEGFRDLLCDRQCFVDGNCSASDALGEVIALDQFHDEGVCPGGFLKPVNRRDVRMIQGRERLCFAFKACDAIGIRGERVGQNLDRDLAIERSVRRTIDLAHAPFTDGRADLVDAEAGTGSKSQTVGLYGRGSGRIVVETTAGSSNSACDCMKLQTFFAAAVR